MLKIELVWFVKKLYEEFGIRVWVIRCDNMGENKDFEKEVEHEQLGLRFEYTVVSTPQQNGRVERTFQTLYGRVRSMLLDSGFESTLRFSLWVGAGTATTTLEGILICKDGISPKNIFWEG